MLIQFFHVHTAASIKVLCTRAYIWLLLGLPSLKQMLGLLQPFTVMMNNIFI